MSITHLVLFKFPHVEEAAECVERLLAMVGRIPQVRTLQAGVNTVPSGRAYDVGLVATFDSLDDLAAYGDHPVHRPVGSWIRERATSIVAVDFES